MAASGALRFTGRVAVITGAGGGLGREYALLLAERGASVVVNDLGGTPNGEGKNSSAADIVVKEIKAKGGKAVPDYNSVEEGEKIVKTAIDNYGRIDILINNAGILRDKSFANITENDWDLVHRVHLKGSFMVTKAAWPYFRKQKYGRVIMTASGAGVYGNFGQSNYSSAKLGLLGLCNTLAVEGARYGIHCNTIVPVAASRLTKDILPPDMYDSLKPSSVSPVVVWLCHESCPETGGVYEAAGGWVGKYQWQRSLGKTFIPPTNLTVEAVRDNWESITDLSDSSSPSTIEEQMILLMESLSGKNGVPSKKEHKVEFTPNVYHCAPDSAILYAIAVGMSTREPKFLNFLYEGSDDFRVLPTFGTIIGMPAVFASESLQTEVGKLNADPSRLLHGEQYLELFAPLPHSSTLTSKCSILDVLDKGSGAVVIVEEDTFDQFGQRIMYSQWSMFFVGAGNFGGKRSSATAKTSLPIPNRPCDSFVEERTSVDQAALYRLCGDKNPIHLDPSYAAIAGFSEPIMHGLCSLGYATRHVLKQYADYDVKLFKSIMARFTSPIVPGHTLRTEMWKEGNRIHFQSLCLETGKTIIAGAYIDLKETVVQRAASQPMPAKVASDIKSRDLFGIMASKLKETPDLASKIQAIYEWNITKNGKTVAVYTVDLKSGQGQIIEGTRNDIKPGCTLIVDDDDMLNMVTGKLNPQKAFMSGKLKIKGNIMLAQKLGPLLAMRDNAPEAAGAQRSTSKGGTGGGDGNPAGVQLKCDRLFLRLAEKLKQEPELANTVKTIYQWNILKNGKQCSTWTLDLKNGGGAVYRGPPQTDKPDCTFILEDDLFSDMMMGRADPQKAFMSGKLKITGNVLASQKLQSLWENPPEESDNASFSTDSPKPAKPDVPQKQQPQSTTTEVPATLKSDFVFQIFAERLSEEPELAQKMKVVYNWNIMKSGKKVSEWTVDLKTGAGSIYRGSPQSGKADVTLTMDDEDVIQLMLGKLNPQRAFMTGRLKIKGNIMLTQKLNQLWQEILKSGRAVELPILSSILADKPFDPSLRSETCFVELGKRVSRMPDLISKIHTNFEWNVTKEGKQRTQWILELKKDKGTLYRGPARGEKPTCIITIDDDVFADWILGKMTNSKVLSSGKLKISGDRAIVSKLFDSFKPQAKL